MSESLSPSYLIYHRHLIPLIILSSLNFFPYIWGLLQLSSSQMAPSTLLLVGILQNSDFVSLLLNIYSHSFSDLNLIYWFHALLMCDDSQMSISNSNFSLKVALFPIDYWSSSWTFHPLAEAKNLRVIIDSFAPSGNLPWVNPIKSSSVYISRLTTLCY